MDSNRYLEHIGGKIALLLFFIGINMAYSGNVVVYFGETLSYLLSVDFRCVINVLERLFVDIFDILIGLFLNVFCIFLFLCFFYWRKFFIIWNILNWHDFFVFKVFFYVLLFEIILVDIIFL